MKKIYVATTNKGKFESLSIDVQDLNVELEMYETDIMEPRSYVLEEIAAKKVMEAYTKIGSPCIAIDGGFYLSAYNNFPGSFTNFVLDTIGLDGMMDLIREKTKEAYFADAIAYMDNTLDKPVVYVSKTKGTCSMEKKGVLQPWHWSNIAYIFIPENYQKTLAELTYKEFITRKRESSFKRNFFEKIINNNYLIELKEQNEYYLI